MADKQETLIDLLRDMSSGDFIDGAARSLKALVATMHEVERNVGGKPKGKVVLTLDLVLDGGIMAISAGVTVREPSKVHGRAIRWGTADGLLVREDPRQMALALSKGPVRDGMPDVRAER